MIRRVAQTTVTDLLNRHAAVGLLGPRQVGKTTLALEIAAERSSVYLDLETPKDRAKLADPELYLTAQSGKLVVLDEIQRVPDLSRCYGESSIADAGRGRRRDNS